MNSRYSVLLESQPAPQKEPKIKAVEPKNSPSSSKKDKKEDLLVVEKTEVAVQPKNNKSAVAKIQEIRVTLPLPTDVLSFLDQMERDIFVRRSAKYRSKQRLTKNSIARAWLDLLRRLKININDVEDEADLLKRLSQAADEFHAI